ELVHLTQTTIPSVKGLGTYVRRGSSRSAREKSPCKGKPCPSNGLKGRGYIVRHHPNRQLPSRDRTTPHRHDTEKRDPRINQQPNTSPGDFWDKSSFGTENADATTKRSKPAKQPIKSAYK